MEKSQKRTEMNIAASKSNKIEYLKRQVKDASTRLAKAQAKYSSYVEKASLFSTLYQEAEANLQNAEAFWELFLKVKSSLIALRQSSEKTTLEAVEAFQSVKQLLIQWEKVTLDTLKANGAIQLAAEYIQKRKASNSLISDDLVLYATETAKKAQTTVKMVINSLTDTLAALSTSAKANNSAELTGVYIDNATGIMLKNRDEKSLSALKKLNINAQEQEAIESINSTYEPLETSLQETLKEAQQNAKKAKIASESANLETNKAKEEMLQATTELNNWKTALAAAEAALAN
jgi:hypothetical protein